MEIIKKNLKKHNYFALFVVLVTLLVFFPFFDQTAARKILFEVIFSLIFIFLLYSISNKREVFIGGLILVIPPLVFGWVLTFYYTRSLEYLLHITTFVYLFYSMIFMFKAVFKRSKISVDLVFGAICIYILLGIFWVQIYSIIDISDIDRSFSCSLGSKNEFDQIIMQTKNFLYYSFDTITTLGSGTVKPISSSARFLSVTEALIGNIYITTFITRMVSLFTHPQKR